MSTSLGMSTLDISMSLVRLPLECVRGDSLCLPLPLLPLTFSGSSGSGSADKEYKISLFKNISRDEMKKSLRSYENNIKYIKNHFRISVHSNSTVVMYANTNNLKFQ